MKICTICSTEKPIEEFLKDKSAKDGYRNQCKPCLRERNKETGVWEKRKDSHNKAMRKFRKTMRGAITTSHGAASQRSKNEGLDFDLTLDYLSELMKSQGNKCALTGVEMIPVSGWTSPSLDKKTPALGYVQGNVQFLTQRANLTKSNMTMDELFVFCESVLELRC